ncbi:Fe-S cluster assembly ATPase SufC [Lacrimispora indolis]|uniref:Fe-S cluster assembly ATPase SufC n=1 Tax=Lacrimispora indolis TaxID=69825 RepID=UPI000407E76D|nr:MULTISPECIES: Fe-S cluster assembly ATPase SufC [Lachnospiraceae]MBE7721945.1 Fe-S cluster assembly ATPase SufC [Lacrimispora celerecrescens]
MLTISGLKAYAGDNEILKGVDLIINPGETHVIMGPNGAGKSTLASVIMGHPDYTVTDGRILFEDEDITYTKTDERARKGIFMTFQNPEEVDGITVESFLRTARFAITGSNERAWDFHKELKGLMARLDFDESYAARYLNVGFSGGEKKKHEILQLLALHPKLAILDETDSGLDVDAVKTVSEGVRGYKNEENALLIITHSTKILENINVDQVHILIDGQIIKTGDASLIDEVNRSGFTSLSLTKAAQGVS